MGAFNAVCFRIGCIFVLALYWEMAAFPTLWALPFFHFVRVPNFGTSPLGSPGQSRDHTLLPKRPRMPAERFIGSDWTTGRGVLDGVTETGAMATPALEAWGERLEEKDLKRWEQWSLHEKDGDSFENSSLKSSWTSHEPWQWPRELHFALCCQLNYQMHHIYEINNQQIIASMLIKALGLCIVL